MAAGNNFCFTEIICKQGTLALTLSTYSLLDRSDIFLATQCTSTEDLPKNVFICMCQRQITSTFQMCPG